MQQSYNRNGVSILPPTGSVIPYLSTTDPYGWLICDGVTRTNGSDGKYNTLIGLGIGTGILNGNYTPPNLKKAFLRGTGISNVNTNYVGPNIGSSQNSDIETHTHTATQDAHTHTYSVKDVNNNVVSSANYRLGFSNGRGTTDKVTNNDGGENNLYYKYPLVIDNSTPAITVNATSGTNIDSNETYPYCYIVNWIIKI